MGDLSAQLVLYGGAFDPPHQGHKALVDQVLLRWPNVQVWVMPAAVPAGVDGQPKQTPQADFADRFAMCQLAFAEAGAGRVVVSPLEQSLKRPNLTINSVIEILKEQPQRSLALLIGLDQWQQFSRWHRADELRQLVELIAVRRPGIEISSSLAKVDSKKLFFLDVATPGVASSQIRLEISGNKEDQAESVAGLSDAVWRYIVSHKLYRN